MVSLWSLMKYSDNVLHCCDRAGHCTGMMVVVVVVVVGLEERRVGLA